MQEFQLKRTKTKKNTSPLVLNSLGVEISALFTVGLSELPKNINRLFE